MAKRGITCPWCREMWTPSQGLRNRPLLLRLCPGCFADAEHPEESRLHEIERELTPAGRRALARIRAGKPPIDRRRYGRPL